MAKGYRTGAQQSGLKAGYAGNGVQEAKQLNQQAMAGRAGQAKFEIGTLGGAARGTQAGYASQGAQQARQLNQKAMQNAAKKAGR